MTLWLLSYMRISPDLQPVVSNNFFSDTRGNRLPLRGFQLTGSQTHLKEISSMMKKCFFAVALLSLALAGGCAKGGNGVVPTVAVNGPSGVNTGLIYPTQPVVLTATTTDPANAAVTWSLSGPGSLMSQTSSSVTYVAPATAGGQPKVTATLTSDSSITGSLTLAVVDVTTQVSPATLSVGKNLTQQFTAIAVPDDAPQTFTWSCNVGGSGGPACNTFHQDPSVSGLAYYTYSAQDSCNGACVQISANSTLDPNGCLNSPKDCTIAKFSLVPYRLSGTYTFRFSGYDSSNNGTAVVGTFTVSNGNITGWEDLLTAGGPSAQNPIQIAGGSYTPASDPNNSNNAGAMTLPSGIYPNKFQVVLDGAGDVEMIESDGHGKGSGIAQKTASSNLFSGDQAFVFGFTGVDASGNRLGAAGVLPINGSGAISGGQMDVNDNSSTANICGSAPCNVAGSYTPDPNIIGLWQMTLTSGTTMKFDIFISGGTASKTNPLTFYAISTDPVDSTHPAVSGTMVLQDSSLTYNNAAFKGTSISALTGIVTAANATCTTPPCSNVALTLGTTDGNGNFSGQFDQNNAGAILSGAKFPPTGSTSYTYAASSTNGRYTFNMLGDPTQKTAVPPIPFVLYASGANRGFLLDQKSASVMTGTMSPQGKGGGGLSNSELPGTYAAATTSSGSSDVVPVAANLLATIQTTAGTGTLTYNISGTQYPPFVPPLQTVAGTYTVQAQGTGTIAPVSPATTPNYAIYVLDTNGCASQSFICSIQDFFMMDVDKTNPNASIMFAQQ
jgi:hypothetical protein